LRVAGTHRLSVERIAQAATVIDPVFLDSPQFRAESLEQDLACRLVVKVETQNPIRSFKGRGTEFLTASLEGRPHLVCATAGNFGQGMAYSARKRALPLTVFTSAVANPFKVERMRALGADVRLVGQDFDAAYSAARTSRPRPAHGWSRTAETRPSPRGRARSGSSCCAGPSRSAPSWSRWGTGPCWPAWPAG